MHLDRKASSPFGWSVPRVGCKPAQVRDEVRTMVDWARETWETHFPERDGYRVEVDSPAGRGHGVQLSVRRGDFRAAVAIENGLEPTRRHDSERLQVRMFGRAQSSAVARTETRAGSLVTAGRQFGAVVGLALAVLLPAGPLGQGFVLLGVLFWTVLTLAATLGGSALGAFLAERMADGATLRAERDATSDKHLQHDLRRWRALSRQLAAQRS
ncbi:MAG: hypothetical protein JKY37_02515, partial [Nannocystaceae bacterium]|nr:hypothetical protein [Nannocystaceae bacterium]